MNIAPAVGFVPATLLILGQAVGYRDHKIGFAAKCVHFQTRSKNDPLIVFLANSVYFVQQEHFKRFKYCALTIDWVNSLGRSLEQTNRDSLQVRLFCVHHLLGVQDVTTYLVVSLCEVKELIVGRDMQKVLWLRQLRIVKQRAGHFEHPVALVLLTLKLPEGDDAVLLEVLCLA